MFNMDLSSAIAFIKEQAFPASFEGEVVDVNIKKPGIMIQCDVDVNDFEEDKRASESVTFLFCGNTSVFAYTGKGIFFVEDLPVEEFANTSNHDTCWRTDGVHSYLSELYFKMCRQVNLKKAPVELHTSSRIHRKIHPVWITYKNPPIFSDSYKKTLVSVSKRDVENS